MNTQCRNRLTLNVYAFLICTFALALLLLPQQSQARSAKKTTAPISVAKVVAVTGQVEVFSENHTLRPLETGSIIQQGDKIKTFSGASLKLKMLDNSSLTIQENQNIAINDYRVMSEPIGEILFLHGKAELWSQYDEVRLLKKGSVIYQGDRIKTSDASSVQIKMVDQGYFAVRPNSEVEISEYIFNKGLADRVNAKLISGGLRSITGQIGQANKKSFRLSTPVATMGIRGTDLVAFYVPETSSQQIGAQSGSYLQVLSGEAVLANQVGIQSVKKNEVAYTASSNVLPVSLDETPELFNQPTYEQEIAGVNDIITTPEVILPAWKSSGMMITGYSAKRGISYLTQTRESPQLLTLGAMENSINTYSSISGFGLQLNYQEVAAEHQQGPLFYAGIEYLRDQAKNIEYGSTHQAFWLGTKLQINDKLKLDIDYQNLSVDQNTATTTAFIDVAQLLQLTLQARLNKRLALTYHAQHLKTESALWQDKSQSIGAGFIYNFETWHTLVAAQLMKGHYTEQKTKQLLFDADSMTNLQLQLNSQIKPWLSSAINLSSRTVSPPFAHNQTHQYAQIILKAEVSPQFAVVATSGWQRADLKNHRLNEVKLQFQF
ncbi:FecR family protein [Oceanospirillum multiglobuliferum]|nr:FecR family protein [Oceanospirillum multiglobuliferum]